MYRTRNLLLLTKKSFCSAVSPPLTYVTERLKERTLFRVSGDDAADYLQGLITNDVRHIQSGGCMYSMFLNTKGRVLYDTIVYKTQEPNIYLIECDAQVAAPLERHLKMYKLRRKVDVNSLEPEHSISVLFNPEQIRSSVSNKREDDEFFKGKKVDGMIFPCDQINETVSENVTTTRSYKDLLIYRDPRVSLLGLRIISPKSADVKNDLSEICAIEYDAKPEENYRWARYALGVGEGVRDLPPGNCFPLEGNCDYLHGVSFHKGCYIGQELTARTHHTGVVRKRLMPLIFSKVPGKMPENEAVMHEGANLGKLRGIEGDAGLGLLRVAKCLDLAEIQIGNGVARTLRPSWWPVEANFHRAYVMDGEAIKSVDDSDYKKDVTLLSTASDSGQTLAETKPEIQHFQCSNCKLREKFDYFGMNPPYTKEYLLLEDCYVIEDPFLPPKRGEFIILGSNCVSCKKPVCKDGECSVYYGGTYCVMCAGNRSGQFPQLVREKISRMKVHSI